MVISSSAAMRNADETPPGVPAPVPITGEGSAGQIPPNSFAYQPPTYHSLSFNEPIRQASDSNGP